MIPVGTDHKNAFLLAVHAIPPHHVRKALGTLTRGIDWTGTSKQTMALEYAHMCENNPTSVIRKYGTDSISLDVLRRRALARERKDMNWATKP